MGDARGAVPDHRKGTTGQRAPFPHKRNDSAGILAAQTPAPATPDPETDRER